MRATKDSGVDWLGEIPADWLVRPLKRNTYIKARVGWKGLTSDEFEVESFAYLVTGRDFSSKVIDFSACYQVSQARYLDDPFIQLKQGDILITKDGTIGKTAWVKELDKPACLNSGIFVVRPRADYVSDFLFWVLESAVFKEFIRLVSSGSTIQHLYQNVFENFSFGIPPLEEQRRIADFLDRETAKIDALIAKQEQLITTLDERRKAIVAQYVSQGMNPGSDLVQTGNPQVPAMPSNWRLKRLRHLAQIESGADYKDLETFEGGFPVYGSGGVFTQASKYMYNGESVLFGRKGTIDKPLYVNGPFWTVDTMYWTRFTQPVNVKFVHYWATTVPFGLFTTSTALPSMTASDIKNFFIAMPPLPEQDQIVKHLDSEIGVIDSLINRSSSFSETLIERRQALISAAVTGKLEVSDGYS